MQYVYLKNNTLTLRSRPKWRDVEGNPVGDEVLEEMGVLPVIYPEDTYNPDIEIKTINPISGWLYTEDDGLLTSVTVTETITPKSLQEVQNNQINKINADFSMAASALTDGYPPAEQATWPTQQQEALAWGNEPSTPTPYLDGLAAIRGIDPEEMRQLTLTQVQAFIAASQYLVGKRQRLRDQIYEAETVEDVLLVKWDEE